MKATAALLACSGAAGAAQLNPALTPAPPPPSQRRKITRKFDAADIVRGSSCGSLCEKGAVVETDFGNAAKFAAGAGVEHHRIAELELHSGLCQTFTALITVSGDFSQPANVSECDVVVGLSDGETVWAVGHGNSYADTLVPFDAKAPTRPSTGHFYDRYANTGGWGGFSARVAFDGAAVSAKVWTDGYRRPQDTAQWQEPPAWTDYPSCDGHATPRGPLRLVLYRDDPDQRYLFTGIDVRVVCDEDEPKPAAACVKSSHGSVDRKGFALVCLVSVALLALICVCRVGGCVRVPSHQLLRTRSHDDLWKELSDDDDAEAWNDAVEIE